MNNLVMSESRQQAAAATADALLSLQVDVACARASQTSDRLRSSDRWRLRWSSDRSWRLVGTRASGPLLMRVDVRLCVRCCFACRLRRRCCRCCGRHDIRMSHLLRDDERLDALAARRLRLQRLGRGEPSLHRTQHRLVTAAFEDFLGHTEGRGEGGQDERDDTASSVELSTRPASCADV